MAIARRKSNAFYRVRAEKMSKLVIENRTAAETEEHARIHGHWHTCVCKDCGTAFDCTSAHGIDGSMGNKRCEPCFEVWINR